MATKKQVDEFIKKVAPIAQAKAEGRDKCDQNPLHKSIIKNKLARRGGASL